MFSLLMGSIVLEIFVCSLAFCRHAGRVRWPWLWVVFAGFLACSLATPVLGAVPAEGGEMLGSLISIGFYLLAFALCVVALARVFDLEPLIALVIGALGYCVQHLGSDISYLFLPEADLITLSEAISFYVPHIMTILATAALVYLVVGRGFRIDADVVSRRAAWVAACVAAVFFVIVFSMAFANDQSGTVRRICFTYDALATAFVMTILVLLSRVDALRANLAANEAIWQRRGEQYQLTRESIDLINEKCHDIRKRVADLRGPALSDESIERIQDSIRVYDASVRTGNDALDVVLTSKSLVCAQNGIELTCLADGGALEFMAGDELYFLMENILDNAIEAVMRLPEPEQRSISLTVRREGDFISIREDNFFAGKLELVDGLPRTSKGDEKNHGFGLRSIRRCVGEHGGEMTLRADGGVFSLSILLPVPDGSSR